MDRSHDQVNGEAIKNIFFKLIFTTIGDYSFDMVVASSSFVRILGECWTIHSMPALFFFLGGD